MNKYYQYRQTAVSGICHLVISHLERSKRLSNTTYDNRHSYSVVTRNPPPGRETVALLRAFSTVKYYCTTLMTWRRLARQQQLLRNVLLSVLTAVGDTAAITSCFLSRVLSERGRPLIFRFPVVSNVHRYITLLTDR